MTEKIEVKHYTKYEIDPNAKTFQDWNFYWKEGNRDYQYRIFKYLNQEPPRTSPVPKLNSWWVCSKDVLAKIVAETDGFWVLVGANPWEPQRLTTIWERKHYETRMLFQCPDTRQATELKHNLTRNSWWKPSIFQIVSDMSYNLQEESDPEDWANFRFGVCWPGRFCWLKPGKDQLRGAWNDWEVLSQNLHDETPEEREDRLQWAMVKMQCK